MKTFYGVFIAVLICSCSTAGTRRPSSSRLQIVSSIGPNVLINDNSVRTGESSRVKLSLPSGAVLSVGENTSLAEQTNLLYGTIKQVAPAGSAIHTKTVEVRTSAMAEFYARFDPTSTRAAVLVEKGSVEIACLGGVACFETQDLPANHCAFVFGDAGQQQIITLRSAEQVNYHGEQLSCLDLKREIAQVLFGH